MALFLQTLSRWIMKHFKSQKRRSLEPSALGMTIGILMCLSLSAPYRAQSETLNISDFMTKKNIDHTHIHVLYQNIFKTPSWFTASPGVLLNENISLKNLSYTASFSQQIRLYDKSKETLNNLESCIRNYFKNNFKTIILPPTEASNKSPKAPELHRYVESEPSNHLSPKLNLGTDYIEPALSIENIFNSTIETNLSYHTADRIIQTNVVKSIKDSFWLSLENITSLENKDDQRVLMLLKYQF